LPAQIQRPGAVCSKNVEAAFYVATVAGLDVIGYAFNIELVRNST